MTGLFLASLEYENYYSDTDKAHFTLTGYGNGLRAVVTISTLFLMALNVVHSRMKYKLQRLRSPMLTA